MNEQGPAKLHRYSARYTPNAKTGRNDYEGMAAFQDGEYVLFADYDQLRQRLAELEKGITRRGDDVILPYFLYQEMLECEESIGAKLALSEQDVTALRGFAQAVCRTWRRNTDY